MSRLSALPIPDQALAVRVWGICTPLEWNIGVSEIAQLLDVSTQRITSLLRRLGWSNRVRVSRVVKDCVRFDPQRDEAPFDFNMQEGVF